MEDLAGALIKRTKLMIEADKKRGELFLKHKADEAQRTREYKTEEASRNREHELRLAQIYASVRPASFKSTGSVASIRLSAICKIYLEIVKTYKQTSLGNVNICHTIIINCDPPRIKEPHKTKKKTCSIGVLLQMSLCSYLYSYILRIKTKGLLC